MWEHLVRGFNGLVDAQGGATVRVAQKEGSSQEKAYKDTHTNIIHIFTSISSKLERLALES